MNIEDFQIPKEHPWGMLKHLSMEHLYEIESFLAGMLIKSIKEKGFVAIKCPYNEDYLTEAEINLLEKVSNCTYKLTEHAQKLLFEYYGK